MCLATHSTQPAHAHAHSVAAAAAEFGIGMRSYAIGPKFRGMKMIPAGIHLVTYGTGIDKLGVFLRLAPGEVHVRSRPSGAGQRGGISSLGP